MIKGEVEELNVLIAGVGGQGNLLSSEIIATAAVKSGFKVRVADVFGAAQRGGSVLSHIRIGEKVFSPVIPEEKTNVLLGFEPVECLRALRLLSPSCIAIINTRPIYPRDVTIGEFKYPSVKEIMDVLEKLVGKVLHRDFIVIAEEAGDPRTLNVVMVGALAALNTLPIKRETFLEAVKEVVPPRTKETNVKAFEMGCRETAKMMEERL